MIKFELSEIFIKRYKSFASSSVFKSQKKITKTDYWEHHSKKIKYYFNNNSLIIEGDSGFYYQEKNLLVKFKTLIKKILFFLNKNEVRYLDYSVAFDKVLKKKSYFKSQINLKKDSFLVKNFKDIKNKFPFKKFSINYHVVRSYYNINLLNSYLDMTRVNCILEIGPGSCNLISLLKYHYNKNCFIIVDLPETQLFSIPIINELFPNSKILFPNENNKMIDEISLKNYNFIFLTPDQIHLLDDNLVDLSINTNSFGEMNLEQVNNYIDFIQRVSKNGSFFFNSNRVEKYPVINYQKQENLDTLPTRFFDYKFHNNEIKFFEICDLALQLQKFPVFQKLEKIIK
jgi:putative sugar O-methyltransferase